MSGPEFSSSRPEFSSSPPPSRSLPKTPSVKPSPPPKDSIKRRSISKIFPQSLKSAIKEISPKPFPNTPPLPPKLVKKTELPEETNKVIKKELIVKVKDQEYHCGTEEAKTVATLDLAIAQQTSQFAYWTEELTKMKLSPNELKNFKEALSTASLKQLNEAQITKNPSKNAPPTVDPKRQEDVNRIFYGMNHAAGMKERSEYYKARGLNFVKSGTTRAVEGGQKLTPSVLTNARYQTYSSKDSILANSKAHCEALRAASFSDVRDPGNTVADLESYFKEPSTLRLDQEIGRREKKIQSLKREISFMLNPMKKDSRIDALQDSLTPLYGIQKFKKTGNENEKLEAMRTIEEKKRFIDDQMVQLITVQVSQNIDALKGDTFSFSYEGLLNEIKKQEISASGLIMDEGNNLKEMESAFQRFAGKKLIFDSKGPYLDKEGHIHLPYSFPKETKEMILEPILSNFTINGSTKNNPHQESLNKKSIQQLSKKITTLESIKPELKNELDKIQYRLNEITAQLNKGDSNLEIASDFLVCQFALRKLMQENNLGTFAISLGCYSVKDRTALVLEYAIIKFAIDPNLTGLSLSLEEKKLIREKLIGCIIDPQGMSAEISFENTGIRVVKYIELLLPGQPKNVSTVANAILYKMDQAKAVFAPPYLE